MNKPLLLFSLCLSMFSSFFVKAQEHYIPKAKNLSKGSYELSVDSQLHSSTSRFDPNGDEKPFLSGESFSQTQAQLNAAFGWREEIQLRAGLRYRLNSSQVISNGQSASLSNSGLESAYLNAQYAVSRKYTKKNLLSFSGEYRQALYSNSTFDTNNPNAVLNLGDAQREISLGMNFFYAMKSTRSKFKGFDFGLGFQNNETLADQITYRAIGIFENGRLALSAGLLGSISLGDPAALPEAFTGATFLYNSTGQDLMTIQAQALYRMNNRWRVSLGFERDLSAVSADIGSRVLIGLSYRVDSKFRQKRQREKFKNYNIEAVIEKVSSQGNYVIVNKGFVHGVQKGMVFDFFSYDFKGGNKLLARGIVARTRSKQSAVKIVEWFSPSRNLDDNVIGRGDINR